MLATLSDARTASIMNMAWLRQDLSIMKMRCFPFGWIFAFALILEVTIAPRLAMAQRPLGTDVSGYQPSINWTTVKNGGVAFAWAKATEGTSYTSPDFASQESGAKGVGIPMGAYHFARPSSHPNITGANSADSEAAYFWGVAGNYVKYGGSYLMPMLDWEDPLVTNQLSAATMSAWVNEWCTAVSNYAAASGVTIRPVVYTGTWYSTPSGTYSGLTTAVTNWPAWIAAYPSSPDVQHGGPSSTYPWPSWNIWQYADTNWSGGDADVYNSNLVSFEQTFVVGGTNAPNFIANPTSLSVALASNATFSVTASGVTPLAFQWQFNGTNIPGATSSNFTINAAQLTDAGGYSVQVSNSYAIVPSSTAFLSVLSQLSNGNGCVLAPTGMTNWWPAEGNANDVYGANNATPNGGFYYAQGEQGLAFHFDGSSGYLYTGAPSLPASGWTISLWVNRQNAPGTAAALFGDGGNGTNELKLEQYGTSREVGVTRFGIADYHYNYIVPAGTWTHLAFVGNGVTTKLYANGVDQGSLYSNAVPVNVSIPCPRAYIGCGYLASSSGKYIDFMLGALDEVMIFKSALSQVQISAIYAAGSAGLYRTPVFTGITYTNGQPQFTLYGQTGKNFTLYSSPDLLNWTLLNTVSGAAGAATYTDTTASGPQLFYQASQPP